MKEKMSTFTDWIGLGIGELLRNRPLGVAVVFDG